MLNKNHTHEKIRHILGLTATPEKPVYGPNDAVSTENTTPYPPDMDDLSRVYDLIRSRRVTTALEFGSRYSTAVIAYALEENRQDFAEDPEFKALRRNNPFELHSVDRSADWLEITRTRVPEACRPLCHLHVSELEIGTFNDRIVHYYKNLPNVCPDFIYLDGPFQHDVDGEINGIHFRHNDRTVVAADIARMEWLLLPGCFILVDGRTNNARFLLKNLQREWAHHHDMTADIHTFELIEAPLGSLNQRQIEFCLKH